MARREQNEVPGLQLLTTSLALPRCWLVAVKRVSDDCSIY